MKKIGITGIDTNVGKTIVSAIVVEAMKADYWKIVQAGDLDDLDSAIVESLISNTKTKIHPEAYLLTEPMSPHAAALIDGVEIDPIKIECPIVENHLIIEGAGGIMVPINENNETIADIFKIMVDEVIVVSKHYLGSINHTLMTLHYLKYRNIPIAGIVFVGDENTETERIILKNSKVKCLGRIPIVDELNQDFISEQADQLVSTLSIPSN